MSRYGWQAPVFTLFITEFSDIGCCLHVSKKTPVKKAPARKVPTRKATGKKPANKGSPANKATVKKTSTKRTSAKKAAVKKDPIGKPTARKTAVKTGKPKLKRQPCWLTQDQMSRTCGISPQAFRQWYVQPVAKIVWSGSIKEKGAKGPERGCYQDRMCFTPQWGANL